MTINKYTNNGIEGWSIIDEKGEHFEPLINSPTEEIALAKFNAMRFRGANPPPPTVQELRKKELDIVSPIDEMVVAIWEDVVEKRPEARIALQAKREIIKAKYPKT